MAREKEKGEAIGRDEWVKVETGTNKGSTVRIQKALAGLPQLVRQRAETAARRMELAARMRIEESRRVLKHA